MSYQTYPSGSWVSGQLGVSEGPPKPPSLRNAVRLMWVGAGVAVLTTIVEFAVRSKIEAAVAHGMLRNAHGGSPETYTAAQIHQFAEGTVVAYIVAGFLSILLWAWMAWANNRASGWARIVASVLFALNTVGVFVSLHRASVSIFLLLAEWLVGLGAILLLWRRATTEYIGPN
jgi:hypothetical protein